MFGLTYLSNDKQRLLRQYEERLTTVQDRQLRNETQLAIQELRSQAKPLKDCDLIEAEELKSQLLQKINTLSGLGKAGSVEAFKIHLKDVDFHIQTLQMKDTLSEQEKMKQPAEAPNLADRGPTITSQRKEKKRQEAFNQHRWLIGMEDEPETDNK